MKKKPDRNDKNQLVALWECPNCGQHHFGDFPPDMCDYCHDFTTWRRITGRRDDGLSKGHVPRPKD